LKHFVIFLLVWALAARCGDEGSVPLDAGYAYFPLKKGIFQVYSVNEIHYTAIAPPETSDYELMTEVVDSFPGPEGYTYVIMRSRRSSASESWTILDTWSARKTDTRVIVSEGNTAFVKVIFPPRSGTRWNGNAFNTLGDDEYALKETDRPAEVNGMTFEKTLTVEQEQNEDLVVFNDQRSEIYARDAGLIYREIKQLNYCTEPGCLGQQKIDNGIEMKMWIKDYGRH
jgi:hypothetical protein